MSELNESQIRIAETLDGMMVVDAGPGTGKTHTIVRRYLNLVSREDVGPRDVLMLTFTRNAANEMEERIKGEMAANGKIDDSKLVQVKTFDAFCMSIVMESPENAGFLFGIEDKLSHSVRMEENETLNRVYFSTFLDSFLEARGEDYGEWATISSQHQRDVYELINRLMSRGIYPTKGGWFGNEDGVLDGDTAGLLASLREMNELRPRQSKSDVLKAFSKDLDVNEFDPLPAGIGESAVEDSVLVSAANEDRSALIGFIHDVYWEYIRRCIRDDRLTFGVNAMLAFSIVYGNSRVRQMNSYRYVMIDEFQDTNAAQLMMALMVLSEPNLCVVGDWKQGIYGFRFVSIENITDFEERCRMLRRKLNRDGEHVRFQIPEALKLPLDVNYRSSQLIVDTAFECLKLRGSEKEKLDYDAIEETLVRLKAQRQDEIGQDTAVRYVQCVSKGEEMEAVADAIRDYVGSGRYHVVEDGVRRPLRLGDIAILCRNGAGCRNIVKLLTDEGIPAFLQGDVEIMATREGKLALAWLRYLANRKDKWGLVPIMADLGYSMIDIKRATDDEAAVPAEIVDQRRVLERKRRRITDLISSIFGWYGLDNDITQAITTVLSTAHRNSLLTISDLVTIIEEDIESETSYPVEMVSGADAVIVMTMHKSKGLEFPAVIIPFVDTKAMPVSDRERSMFSFSDQTGIRCSRTIGEFAGYSKICRSWRTKLIGIAKPTRYDEERRLMFVAMSRAKQYETLICGPKPSYFMRDLPNGGFQSIPPAEMPDLAEEQGLIDPPEIGGYHSRTPTIGVHGIMDIETEDGLGGMAEEPDEVCHKGRKYGTDVHEEAHLMELGMAPSGRFPESEYIASEVLSRRGMDGFIRSYSEIECTLPIIGGTAILKGVIDLLLVFEDRIEVHDYKTDETDRFQREYEIQLSAYALAVGGFYRNLPVRCFIDYVSQGRTVEIEPLSQEALDAVAAERIARNQRRSLRTPNIRSRLRPIHGRTDLRRSRAAQGRRACQRQRGQDRQDLHRHLREERAHAVQRGPVHPGHPPARLRGAHQRRIGHWDHHSQHPDLHDPGDARQAQAGQDIAPDQTQGHRHEGRRRGRSGPERGREGRHRHPPRRRPGRRRRDHRLLQIPGDGRVAADR